MSSSKALSGLTGMRRGAHHAFIALGSNLGDRIDNIEKALDAMRGQGLQITRISSLYETQAMYYENQGNFLNGVCMIETDLDPLALLNILQGIEQGLGRVKVIDKGPRNIDLDILLYDLIQFQHERLSIPHQLMHERWFVLKPFFEICPPDYFPPSHGVGERLQQSFTQLQKQDAENKALSVSAISSRSPLLKPTDPSRSSWLMAILNLTPDSFSDGGVHNYNDIREVEAVVRRFVAEGAHIVDIGGQSTRPNATLLTPEEELSRILPHIKYLRSLPGSGDFLISVDTFYSDVAREAIIAGADIINDVSGGLLDSNMLSTVAELHKTIILMHMRGMPQTMTQMTQYPRGLLEEIRAELRQRILAALTAGIPPWRIVLDPGIGFAKTQSQNLELLRRLGELRDYPDLQGFPWLVGTSRKGFIGKITGVQNASERRWGTAAAVTAAVAGGADILRVHDVAEMAQLAKMADAIYRQQSTT